MDDNRIRVKFQPELTPVRLEDKVDVKGEIDVGVETHLKGLGVAGGVLTGLGFLAVLVALVLLSFGYPTPWYGSPDDATHVNFVKTVVLLAAGGIILLFFGTSAFFYGRTVLGSGHLDEFATRGLEVAPGFGDGPDSNPRGEA